MRLLTLVAILMASVFISSSQTHANAPADLSYTVLRNGDPIGTHAYTFREK
ncbi:MAG: hypothetical protein ISR53_09725, partial [Rhodospirillales bacterium]|nr:hypothetical protein [Rhodospirillales bacterium]